jgi:hypothetical protein
MKLSALVIILTPSAVAAAMWERQAAAHAHAARLRHVMEKC